MLTTFFGKSKPINFIIVSIFIISWIFLKLVIEPENLNNPQVLVNNSLITLGYLFLLFLINFIVKKNRLTGANTYTILFFSCFLTMIPPPFAESNFLLSNLFLLLALRRIWSLASEKNLERKIFDASIWISLAALFYFWSLLLLLVLFISILQIGYKNLKLLWIPFVGVFAVFILTTAYNSIVNDALFWFMETEIKVEVNYATYNSLPLLVIIVFFVIMMIWGLAQKAFSVSKGSLKEKLNFKILFIVSLAFFAMVLLNPIKNGTEFLFIITPLAIITTNLLENRKAFWVKELILWFVVLLPIIINLL